MVERGGRGGVDSSKKPLRARELLGDVTSTQMMMKMWMAIQKQRMIWNGAISGGVGQPAHAQKPAKRGFKGLNMRKAPQF